MPFGGESFPDIFAQLLKTPAEFRVTNAFRRGVLSGLVNPTERLADKAGVTNAFRRGVLSGQYEST